MPTSAASSKPTAPKFVAASTPDFWISVGIFEDALKARAKTEELLAEARNQLAILGPANLRLLCEKSSVPRDSKAGSAGMVNVLIEAADEKTLIHIREFLRRRTEAIEEVFEATFTEAQRKGIEADLDNLSESGRSEKLKPLTKLLLVYQKNPSRLLDAFYLQLWRSRPTYQEFQADKEFPKNAAAKLQASESRCIKLVKAALSKEGVRLLGIHTLPDQTVVVVLHREFSPTIRRDFREEYNVHFGCGVIVFGINADHDRLVVKVGNAKLTDALKFYFEDEFDLKLHSLRGEVFSDYDPKSLESVFQGSYSEDSGIQIAAADFRRSGLTSRSPLSIRSQGASTSIRTDLQELAESKTVQLRALDDLTSLTVLFNGKAAQITVEMTPGGAVILKFSDIGWSDDQRLKFEDEFLKTFGIPVNRYIDPQRLEMGGLRVVASLLSLTDEEDVQPYQQEKYAELIDAGILVCEGRLARVCRSLMCRPKKPFLDETIVACPRCDRPIEDSIIREINRGQNAIANTVSEIFEAATGFALGKTKTFEGLEYYPLRKKAHPESEEICVIVRDRLWAETKLKFQRSSQPLVMIEAHTDERYVYLDDEGIGRVSFAYVYTAQQSKDEKKLCATSCRQLVKELLVHHQERVSKAARISYQHLMQGTTGDKGHVYEMDVFNVLRSVLPYCYQCGREGKIEPDGFVCLPQYEQEAMEGVDTWNWSYDAKHSDKPAGYDLNIDERRKIVNYIDKFRAKLPFWDKSTRLRAHVVISDKISEAKRKATAEFVFSEENGVKKGNRHVRLVFMQQDFVTRLYQLVAEKKDDYQRRRPLFGNLLINLLFREGTDRYTVLTNADAEGLFEELIKLRPVEKAMTERELISGLD